MENASLKDLARLTLTNPRLAAREVIKRQPDRTTMWGALILTAIVATIALTLSVMYRPPTVMPEFPVPGVNISPFSYLIYLGGLLVVVTIMMFWVGRSMGGTGSLNDVLAGFTWVQVLSLIAKIGVMLLGFVAPLLALTAISIIYVGSTIIMVLFFDEIHQFKSVGRAFGALILSFIALLFGFSFILFLIRVLTFGINGT